MYPSQFSVLKGLRPTHIIRASRYFNSSYTFLAPQLRHKALSDVLHSKPINPAEYLPPISTLRREHLNIAFEIDKVIDYMCFDKSRLLHIDAITSKVRYTNPIKPSQISLYFNPIFSQLQTPEIAQLAITNFAMQYPIALLPHFNRHMTGYIGSRLYNNVVFVATPSPLSGHNISRLTTTVSSQIERNSITSIQSSSSSSSLPIPPHNTLFHFSHDSALVTEFNIQLWGKDSMRLSNQTIHTNIDAKLLSSL